MKNYSVTITVSNDVKNSKNGTIIADRVETILSEKSRKSAIGEAFKWANEVIRPHTGRSQYDALVVLVDGKPLNDKHLKLINKPFFEFRATGFPILREEFCAEEAFTDEKSRVQYIRDTDKNGIFAKQKTFTVEQTAAQAHEQLNKTKFAVQMTKATAVDSVWTPQELMAKAALSENARVKRALAAKVKATLTA